MELTLLNRLGEWNPQLFRELKGQFKPRNLFITVASSLIGQFFVLLIFSEQNCLERECTKLDWQIQWQFVFITLSWMLPLLLLIGGVYQLINDLAKEERQGTLNFIRLSPQSSQSILTGKILGVPALFYLGVALAVPLHLVSGLAHNLPLAWLLATYTLWGAGCALFYVAALFYTLLWNSQGDAKSIAGAGSILACFVGLPYLFLLNYSHEFYYSEYGKGDWGQWFWLEVGSQPSIALIWMLLTLSVATYWLWGAVNRRFANPNATLLSKTQSYWLVACFELWLLGFVVTQASSYSSDYRLDLAFGFLFVVNPLCFLILIFALSPNRQALLDWTRYRRKSTSAASRDFWHQPLVKDLIQGEKSPALVAIALNLLITATVWVPGILLLPSEVWSQKDFNHQQALLALFLTMNVILIYGAIAQLSLFLKTSKQGSWAALTIGAVAVLPLVTGGLLGWEMQKMTLLWLFSPLPVFTLANASITTVFLGLLTQLGVLGLLSFQLTRKLQKAGESQSKAIFAQRASRKNSSLS